MTTRRQIMLALASLAAMPALAQDRRVRRIGFLALRSRPTPSDPDPGYAAFVQGLRELGYREGENLSIEWRYADNDYERLPALAKELVSTRPELIATQGPGAQAMIQATKIIPIVVAIMSDPVGNGWAESLARPGKNLTGLTQVNEETSLKHVELLKQVLPKLSRVALLVNPRTPSHPSILKSVAAEARKLGVAITEVRAGNPEELDQAFQRMSREKAQGVVVLNDAFFAGQTARIAKLATAAGVPSVSSQPEAAPLGFLLSYGPDNVQYYRRAAKFVDRILKGANAAELPIERPTEIRFLVNRATAKKLGLAIPEEWRVRAERVIE
jgi:putative ABC transport system substrate-binding protein